MHLTSAETQIPRGVFWTTPYVSADPMMFFNIGGWNSGGILDHIGHR